MESSAAVPSATLRPKEERRLLRGHCWAYRNEFAALPELEDGGVVDVFSAQRRFVGRGYFQTEGGIAVRLLARHQVPVDEDFFHTRLSEALALRKLVAPGRDAWRWVHGESDGLPGLVADVYGGIVHAVSGARFYWRNQAALAAAFQRFPETAGVRVTAGPQTASHGEAPDETPVDIGGLRFHAPLAAGQKTGLFLDQQENVMAMRSFVAGRRVLDGHCYAGVWACHAAAAGALEVIGVDTSAPAIEWAARHGEENGLSGRCRFETASVADALTTGAPYGAIFLDPPALAKGRGGIERALGVYQALNRDAFKALEPGGVLITSSCSQPVSAPAFLEMLKRAARAAQRDAVILAVRGAAMDHPVHLSTPETAYLKCVFAAVR